MLAWVPWVMERLQLGLNGCDDRGGVKIDNARKGARCHLASVPSDATVVLPTFYTFL